jgi:tRNA pseudouridine synthase 9
MANGDTSTSLQNTNIAELDSPSSHSAPEPPAVQLSMGEALGKLKVMESSSALQTTSATEDDTSCQPGNLFCPDCYLPLHPDPKPEKLYIFLHALKYTTSLGTFQTEMPKWAEEGWEWER